jgi:aspartate 1-decarboxylase
MAKARPRFGRASGHAILAPHDRRRHPEPLILFLRERPIIMFRTLLKSKIHRATVTDCELHYEGSCAIDEDLLDAANLAENEQVHIWNINNGERFVTYAIRGQRGSGIISVNGSAARRASVGDLIIIAAFGLVPEDTVADYLPKLVFVDGANRIKEERAHIPVQAASGESVMA